MNNNKWNNVLREWVNCLKLCKNINTIEDLRNGEFFSNLQKVLTKSCSVQVDILTFIFDLLGKHYPNYSFENKTEIHLSDVPEIDLKALTSLLMHYTCIYDRKDVLTSPLCHSLSQSTQLIIRNFLQKITKDVTSVTMNHIIKSCIDDASDHVTNQWLSSVENSSMKNSPLQDLLKTPISKFGRLQEKDRIIAKLKTELEAERFDKVEIQEDLKRQIEKNKKVDQQMTQKNNEILRLRAEVLALENRTPPNYQDMDSRELQRRLRSEIQSLEQYIKQIEEEQAEIIRERDTAKEQLRKIESQSRIWEEKFFEIERNFESLKEHSKEQEDELLELKIHCTEVNALLDEYRAKPNNDSSMYDTFTSMSDAKSLNETTSCEDLACSVVEVQLRDAQRQNEELKKHICDYEKRQARLEEEFMEAEVEKKKSEKRNTEFTAKIQNMEQSEKMLSQHLLELQNNLRNSEKKMLDQQTEIANLTTELNVTLAKLLKQDNINEELQLKVTFLGSHNETLEKHLSEVLIDLEIAKKRAQDFQNDHNTVKTLSEKLQFELADVVLNSQKLTLQLDDLKGENDNLLSRLDDCESTRSLLESHLSDSRQCSETLKLELGRLQLEYNKVSTELDKNHAQFEQEKAQFIAELHKSNEKSYALERSKKELMTQVSNLENLLTEALNRIESNLSHTKELEGNRVLLEKQLKEVQTYSEHVDVKFSELQNKTEEMIRLLNEKDLKLQEVENEKSHLETKIYDSGHSILTLMQKNEDLSAETENFQSELRNVNCCLEVKTEEVELLKQSCDSLEIKLNEALICLEKSQGETEKKDVENQKLSGTLHDIQTKLETVEERSRILIEEKEELGIIINNLKKESTELQEEVLTLVNSRCELETTMTGRVKILEQNENNLQALLDEAHISSEKLREEVEKKCEENHIIVETLRECEAKLQICEEKSRLVATEKEGLSLFISTLEKEVKDLQNEIKVLIKSHSELESSLKARLEILEETNKNLQIQLDKAQNEDQKNRGENQKLIETLRKTELKLQTSEQVSQVLVKEKEELDFMISNLKMEVIDFQEQAKALTSSYSELEAATETRLKVLEENNNSLQSSLDETRICLEHSQEELQKKLVENLKLIQNLQEIEARLHISEERNQAFCKEKEDLEAVIYNLKKEETNLREQINTLSHSRCNLETRLGVLEDSKNKQETLLIEANNTVKQLNSKILVVESQYEETCQEYTKLKTEKLDIEKKLLGVMITLDDFQTKLSEVEECSKEERNEIERLLKEKKCVTGNENFMDAKNHEQVFISNLDDYEVKCLKLKQKLTKVINNLIMSNEQSEELVKKLEDERIILTSRVALLEENLAEIEVKNRDLLAQKSSLEKQKDTYDELILKYEANKDLTQEFMRQREESCNTLGSEKEILTQQLEDLKVQLKDLKQRKDDFYLQNQILKQRVAELSTENEKHIVESQRYQDSSVNNLQEKDKLQEKFLSLSETLMKLETENEDLIVQNSELKEKTRELLTIRDDCYKQIENLLGQNEKLQIRLSSLEKDHNQLKNYKDITDRQLDEVSVLSETLKREGEEVRLQYQKSQNELKEMKDALVKIMNEKDDIAQCLKETKDEKNEVQKTLDLIMKKLNNLKIETKFNNGKDLIISKSENIEKRITNQEDPNCHEVAFVKVIFEIESMIKRAEAAEENLEKSENEIVLLNEKLEQLAQEKSIVEKKFEIEEIISLENSDRAKTLEETVQDYEITISGLKKVVDTNFEKLEGLKKELSEREDEEVEIRNAVNQLLVDNNINTSQTCEDFRSFIFYHFDRILKTKNEQVKRIVDLETEIKELKNKNLTFVEMVEKLQRLVNEKTEICSIATLKSCFDDVHIKVNNLLKSKQQLMEDLQRSEGDKVELNKQLEIFKVQKDEILKAKIVTESSLNEEKEKVETLRKELENRAKAGKPEKENILGVSTKSNKSREEELKKENMMLKRKVVLTENAKNNLEKVLKELREEKKKTAVSPPSPDVLYKKLLQEYIQVKEENERVLKERDAKIGELSRKIEELKIKNVPIKTEDDKKLQNLREAYGSLMSVNSKLELEMVTLRKIIEDRNSEMASLSHIKEAYEKLLEENNKIITEVDTLKYKRMRDKEEFVRLLRKERETNDNREIKKIQDIRSEYEGKLEKMKEKMLKLYREEVNKKVKSMKDGQNETATLIKTVGNLKSELFEADQKIQLLEMEREMLKSNRHLDRDVRTIQLQSMSSITSITTNAEKSATLPRSSTTKEFTISQRTSIGGLANLQMEDEEDLFNDKYLADLKEGKCTLPMDRSTRFSELAWRNSMVPPHLKSSYPAEMQFVSPSRFKDDDIKAGNIELEDSLCKLLPGEKPRKKDFGTTSYKKPGPPTPSKNGGRLSLQGNEVHPLRDHCEAKTPKRSTPSRIKALFTGRNSSSMKDACESQNVTPSRGRRLNIFRRPR